MGRDDWISLLDRAERELGFEAGYKFLYGPWASLEGRKVGFFSLNPGRPPDDAEPRTISDERGNSYEVEQQTTRSPITRQFLLLADFLGLKPSEILTGVVAPFRSNSWAGLTKEQREGSLALGKQFWADPLSRPALRLVFACSNEAKHVITELVDASLDLEILAGWGAIKLRRYRAANGKVVVHLPHLSRFQLLGRSESESALRELLSAD